MSYDELAFLNLQLAAMLKSGIPLEGGLRQLAATARQGGLRTELQKLEADLANGMPLEEALTGRQLPDLYRRMVLLGAQSQDLPGVLTLLADHYRRVDAISTRLKGLMVYPSIVILASLALSIFLALFLRALTADLPQLLNDPGAGLVMSTGIAAMVWMPVLVLSTAAAFGVGCLIFPALRRWLRWHLPGFKEAALAQLASAMRLMLKAGTNLGDALGLLGHLENKTPAGRDVAQWQRRLAQGHTRFAQLALGSRVVPPLFAWLVSSSDEDLAEGFARAADIYQARAGSRIEMLLYAALPISILFVGVMVLGQAYPLIRLFVQFGSLLDRLGQ
jgi:type II secretory pathway component PulF